MVEESEIEEFALRIFEENKEGNKSLYHSRFAEELTGAEIEYEANPPPDWHNSSSNNETDSKKFNEIGSSSSLGPVYSFFLEDELYIEIVSKDEITKEDKQNLEKSVKFSDKWLYVPDNIFKGVMINFVEGGAKPEFYWFRE